MKIPPSDHFSTVSLGQLYNQKRDQLPKQHPIPVVIEGKFGIQSFRGIPFDIGPEHGSNVCLLEDETLSLDLNGQKASYILFLHVVRDELEKALPELPSDAAPAMAYGGLVSDYTLEFEDGERISHPIQRRFAIQQYTHGWGSSSMASIPARKEAVFRSNTEDIRLRKIPIDAGKAETRNHSARDADTPKSHIYALPNPNPDKALKALHFKPSDSSALYAISLTQLEVHPLRFQTRRKLLLTLPAGVKFNDIAELDDIEFDLGNVISARQQLIYKPQEWQSDFVDVQPSASENTAVIEYAAHPAAKLYLQDEAGLQVYDLANLSKETLEISPAHRPVKVRVIDKTTRVAIGVRIHFHGEAGEYLPPIGTPPESKRHLVHGQLRRIPQWTQRLRLHSRRMHSRCASGHGVCGDIPRL